jgi:RNA polymerase sigma factor (sigma-70 family)
MTKKGIEQRQLWSAFLAGEEQAFSRLFFDYYEILYHYGNRISPQPAVVKDTIQDFFLELYESRTTLSLQVNNLKAYLLTSFRRRLLRELKKQRQKHHALETIIQETEPDFELGMEDVLIEQEVRSLHSEVIAQLLSELPPRQREIIYLRYYLNLSLPEIAETLGISYQVVANQLYRAVS